MAGSVCNCCMWERSLLFIGDCDVVTEEAGKYDERDKDIKNIVNVQCSEQIISSFDVRR